MKAVPCAILFILMCVGSSACSTKAPKPPAPNVVVISIDTLRSDSLRAYDDAARPRPSLDRLAQRGHTFAHAYSPASWTLPAHVSLFTGLYPDRHGVVDPRFTMGRASSFVQELEANGYQTVGFTDGGYVNGIYGFTRGFETYDGWRQGDRSSMNGLPRDGKRHVDTKAHLFDRAIAFLEGRQDPRPLFLFVHTYAVHDYFRSRIETKPARKMRATQKSAAALACLVGTTSCAPEKWQEMEGEYEDGIDRVDGALGHLLELIDEKLNRDNTFVFLLSDHGEGFDHVRNRIHHGGRLHRDQLQVPLIVAGPGISRDRSTQPVSLVDVRASILELTRIGDSHATDGHSFVPQLVGEEPKSVHSSVWATEYYYYWENGERRTASQPSPVATSTARIGRRYWRISGESGEELYDIADRAQMRALAPASQQHTERDMQRTLTTSERARMGPTEEIAEQLRALGYIE